MPFVNYPIECSTCRGSGRIKPVCAFRVHEEILTTECINCRGVGTMENRVYVNPMPADSNGDYGCIPPNTEVVVSNDALITIDKIAEVFSNEEIEKVTSAIKKVKSKKVSLDDSNKSTKLDSNDAS